MKKIFKKARSLFLKEKKVEPNAGIEHGISGIENVGHRAYVGGLWDEIGKLQFDFMINKGLKPHHYLIDIACGSLRGGIYFIPYLNKKHYLGIEKEQNLIEKGIKFELDNEVYINKEPVFVISDSFEFDIFGIKTDFAIAQSLFSHLTPELINLCFRKLHLSIKKRGSFYATFFESGENSVNPTVPHDHKNFYYTKSEILNFGLSNGWKANYIGNWSHPRGQVMVEYIAS